MQEIGRPCRHRFDDPVRRGVGGIGDDLSAQSCFFKARKGGVDRAGVVGHERDTAAFLCRRQIGEAPSHGDAALVGESLGDNKFKPCHGFVFRGA